MVIRKVLSVIEREVHFQELQWIQNEPDINSAFIGTYSLVEELRHGHWIADALLYFAALYLNPLINIGTLSLYEYVGEAESCL